jgi:hypothetical protein
MEVVAVSFFFAFLAFFLALALVFHSRTLYFVSGVMLILFGYLMLSYGLTETTMSTQTQNLTYTLNESTNVTSLTSTSTGYIYVEDKNDYTNGFGTIAILLGLLFAISPIISEASGGRTNVI